MIAQSDQPAGVVPEADQYLLRLYVAGQTAKSLNALANLRRVCEEHLTDHYVIEVVDLLVNPALAAEDGSGAKFNAQRNRNDKASGIQSVIYSESASRAHFAPEPMQVGYVANGGGEVATTMVLDATRKPIAVISGALSVHRS